MKFLLTIDPGVSGGWVFRHLGISAFDYDLISSGVFSTDQQAAKDLTSIDQQFGLFYTAVVMEQVHASPVMSPSSAFSFGTNFGIWRGALAVYEKPILGITPHQWQSPYAQLAGLQGSKRKSELNRIAKKAYPQTHVTLNNCDALLISDYCVAQHKLKGTVPGKFI